MDEDIDTYLGLSQPELSNWSKTAKDAAQKLKMFGVRQPFSLLLAAHRHFSTPDFETMLRACVNISFRYHSICSLPPQEQERVYTQVANRVSDRMYTKSSEAIVAMKEIYPEDKVFQSAFATLDVKASYFDLACSPTASLHRLISNLVPIEC